MHQVFESWRRHIPTAFSHFVFAPTNLDSRHAKDCLIGELDDFESSFVEWIGNGIPDERIRKAGEVYNANRRLLHSIYDLRKSDNVPISGEEALQVTLSSMLMDKEEHNSLLEQLLRELPGRERKARSRTRLMIVGCDFDDPELFRLIEESLDADIVIDDSGTGSRYFWSELSGDSASTVAIADRLLNIPPSPIHDHGETRHRPPHILKMARDYRVDCVAIVVRTFCDSHQFDIPAIRGALETNGIPVIVGKWGGPVHCVKSKCKEGLVKMLRNDMEKVKRESIRG